MGSQQAHVGVFVDVENIRLGWRNATGQEPDPLEWMEMARSFGPVAVAQAFGDFSVHNDFLTRRLDVAGFQLVNVLSRGLRPEQKQSADMAMLMAIFDCLLDQPQVCTLVLMTGDSDFIRITTRARNKFAKRVIVAGVEGTVSADLAAAANEVRILHPGEPEGVASERMKALASHNGHGLRALHDDAWARNGEVDSVLLSRAIRFIAHMERQKPFLTYRYILDTLTSPRGGMNLADSVAHELLDTLVRLGALNESIEDIAGRTQRIRRLNRDLTLIQESLRQLEYFA